MVFRVLKALKESAPPILASKEPSVLSIIYTMWLLNVILQVLAY